MSDGSAGLSRPEMTGGVVELRVHGVSGASAAHVLDLRQTAQVAGDRNGGFYRPRPLCEDTGGVRGVTLEAYRWGDLPSGTVARTLALVFLLPFMLANLAIWMRPADPGSAPLVKSLCRVLALTVTALYVLAIAGVALDLIAWKCPTSPRCLAGRSWLSWLGGQPVGLRLALLAVLPVTAIGLIWRISNRPGRTFDAFHAPEKAVSDRPLGTVGQWDAEPLVGRLRSIHVATAFATLDLVLLLARTGAGASVVTVALVIVTGAVLVACVALLCTPSIIDRGAADRRLDGVTRALRTIAIILTVVVVTHVLASPARWHEQGTLPGYDATLTWLFVTQTTLLAILGVVLLWRRDRRAGVTPLFGLGALVIMAVAVSLGVAYSAELVHRTADFLDRDLPTGEGIANISPPAYTWAIYGFVRAVLITLIVALLIILFSRRGRYRAAAAIVALDYPDPPPETEPRLRQVRQAIARARFTEKLVPLAVVYSCLAGLGTATTAFGLLELFPSDLINRNTRVPADVVTFGIAFGSWVIAAIILSLIIAGVFAYRSIPFRRHVGVLWDLGTFWPRAAHPFAPPCYAERAVPELARRITYLVTQGNAVLLTGHSHGSVLLAATVLQLPPEVGSRVALLTHGSPLRRLYGRIFPAYVDDAALREIGGRIGWRWVNLWRDTDGLGGWIFSAHRPGERATVDGPPASVDRRLRDPSDVVTPPGDSVPPPIQGHGPDESDESFAAAARELVQRLVGPADPPGTAT
ncbi:hypothetical protein [Micromonospora sp. CV4]|uniref:hypothetical protein n=1 Tax=Micromonospora sp. CV4 TaxID=2478711 RepID=UPI0018F6097C|nr:hypothetical protein [Micromonospora sp. CV4]